MNQRPNVYVVNKSAHDFSDAYRFGDLVFLSEGKQSRYAANDICRQFKPILEVSEPNDYILLTSLTVMNVIAASLFSVSHGKLNLLIHQSETNSYVERRLDLSDLAEKPISQFMYELKD